MSAVVERMDSLVTRWGTTDRRSLFAAAYRRMSAGMFAALESGEFDDSNWVDRLLGNFAGYYFHAVDAYEGSQPGCPKVWTVAFEASRDDEIHPLRVLFLGINAHINYDLALSVADVMGDWSSLEQEQQEMRRSDYERVDRVIHHTINAVQDQVVAPAAPIMGILDKLLGPVDEWLFTALLANWRRDTWSDAIALLSSEPDQMGQVMAHVESRALHTADWIIHVGPD